MTAISEYHIQAYQSLDSILNELEQKAGNDTVLKSFQVTCTYFVKDDKWISHRLDTDLISKRFVPCNLPRKNKQLLPFLIDELSRAKDNSLFNIDSTLQEIAKKMLTMRPGNPKLESMLELYREINAKMIHEKWFPKFKQQLRTLIFSKMVEFGSELMIHKLTISMTVLSKPALDKEKTVHINSELAQRCLTCNNWLTTAQAIDECKGCLKSIPIPTEHCSHNWKDHKVQKQIIPNDTNTSTPQK